MIRNIIFDVGMVLVDFCWEKALRDLGFTGETFEAVANATVRSSLWIEVDRSRMSDRELLAGFIKNAPEQEANIRLFWDHIEDVIACYPYANDWVRELKERGYRCYILSNYGRRLYERTGDKLSFEKLMDGALFSFLVQQVKPEAQIYETLLERFELKPEECIFFDDNLDNVEAARKLGIHGVQFTSREEAEQVLADILKF